jgi:hypothetical protein
MNVTADDNLSVHVVDDDDNGSGTCAGDEEQGGVDDSPSVHVDDDEEQGFSTAITDDDVNTTKKDVTMATAVYQSSSPIIGLEQVSCDGDTAAPVPLNQQVADLEIDTAEKSSSLPEELATDDDVAPIPPGQQFDDVAIKLAAQKQNKTHPRIEDQIECTSVEDVVSNTYKTEEIENQEIDDDRDDIKESVTQQEMIVSGNEDTNYKSSGCICRQGRKKAFGATPPSLFSRRK